jgi:TolB-like protein
VVSGTAHLNGGRVRVHLALNESGTGEEVWAVDFECDGDDIRAAQARITAEILEGVATAVPGESPRTVATTGPAAAAMM